MKKLLGLAAVTGIAAGAVYFLKKSGMLNITNEETEQGGHRYGVELNFPQNTQRYTDECCDCECNEEAEEGETAEKKGISVYMEVSPEAAAMVESVKTKANQAKESVMNTAQNFFNNYDDGFLDDFEELILDEEEETEETESEE